MEPSPTPLHSVTMVTGACGSGLFSGMKNAMLCGSSLKRLRRHQLPLSPTTPPPGSKTSPRGIARRPMGAGGPGGPASPHSGVVDLEDGKENFENRAESNGDTACNATSRLEGESPVALPGGYSRNRGQLKLSISSNRNQLTIHVAQARHLKPKWSETCSPYVEISLVPGDNQALCQTSAVLDGNQPSFAIDETFTLEMMEEDQKKRLNVAMYNKENKENAELLGCMTFGVKNLMCRKKKVDSWYYLLSDDIGRRKHLQVTGNSSRRSLVKDKAAKSPNSSRGCSTSKLCKSSSIPEVNRSLQGRDTITVVVRRGRLGYGFTVMGSSPVTIGKVEEGTPAESAGLKKGDNVVRINGQNVSRSTADSVAKIVKTSPKQIVLDVVRAQYPLRATGSVIRSEGLPVYDHGMGSTSTIGDPFFPRQPCPSSASEYSSTWSPASRRTPIGGHTPSSFRGMHDTLPLRPSQAENVSASRTCSNRKSRKSSSSRSSSSKSATLRGSGSSRASSVYTGMTSLPAESDRDVAIVDSTGYGYDSLRWDASSEEIFFPTTNQEICDELPWKPFDCDRSMTSRDIENTYATMHADNNDDASDDEDAHETAFLDDTFMDDTDMTVADETGCDADESSMTVADYAHTTLPEVSVSFRDLTHRERARQAAAQQLRRAEVTFIAQMQDGIQRYSRPLRHCILSAREHRVLFQNVEKLVAFSEYHMCQLAETSLSYADVAPTNSPSGDERYVDVVGSVFRQKVSILCEAYELYCEGLSDSLKLLADLKTYEQFHHFLADPATEADEPTIDDFLRKPQEHLQTLMLTLRTVLSHTARDHRDAEALERVVEDFTTCYNKISTPADQTLPNTSSTTTSSSYSSSFASSKSSSARSATSSGSALSVDSELLEMQERLVFPDHVTAFQLATPSRHVIYTGELLRVESCMWERVVVILLSDLLLICRVEGDSLVVVEDPLSLPDVMNAEFGGSHACEFTLTAEVRTGSDVSWEVRHLLLRAPSMEQQCTWKSLLEQRIASFRSHRELMTGRSREAVY